MPELPDLQVFSKNLNKTLAGKTLQKANVINHKKLNVSEGELKKALEKKKLKTVFRSGKELHFEFEDKSILRIHLMLHGKLYLFNRKNEQKHVILELIFKDETGLALTDYQGMATPTLNPEKKEAPDALSKEVNADYLKRKLSETKTTIKTFLLDQNKIRGIGNAYADEILWHAGISPVSVCNKIPVKNIELLDKKIKDVLTNAEKQILKTHPNIIAGEVRDFLDIHNSKRAKSPTGNLIHHKTISSRITYYTDEQELFN